MDYIKLGTTDMHISRIGFGCAPMGGYDYGEVLDDVSIEAVRRAIDLGINFFDTADIYGFGHAEEVLSKALGKDRHKVIIATKFGLEWDNKGNVSRNCSPDRILSALNSSLKRLRIDAIPLYQLHWCDPKRPIEETFGVLLKCRQAGKIMSIGISNPDAKFLKQVEKVCRVDVVQSSYNLLNRTNEGELVSLCRELGIAFIGHSPLARGFLTGKYNTWHNFPGTDTRNRSSYFSEEMLSEKKNVLKEVQQISMQYKRTCTQVVIRWILDNPQISGLILGVKNAKQIEEGVGSLGWKLDECDYETLCNRSEPFCIKELY